MGMLVVGIIFLIVAAIFFVMGRPLPLPNF